MVSRHISNSDYVLGIILNAKQSAHNRCMKRVAGLNEVDNPTRIQTDAAHRSPQWSRSSLI